MLRAWIIRLRSTTHVAPSFHQAFFELRHPVHMCVLPSPWARIECRRKGTELIHAFTLLRASELTQVFHVVLADVGLIAFHSTRPATSKTLFHCIELPSPRWPTRLNRIASYVH